jgi:hypothetical protein
MLSKGCVRFATVRIGREKRSEHLA